MRNKRLFNHLSLFILPVLLLTGCQSSNESELQQMIKTGQQIEIEIATPISEEQGTTTPLTWVQLDQLTTYSQFRSSMDDLMKITTYGQGSKNGIAYINLEGQQEGNNTLFNALNNRKFITNFLENDSVNLELQQTINSVYADADESEAMVAAINAYWNLLADAEPNYFNGGSTISRLEAMSLLARASHQVTDEVGDAAFTEAVGQTDYTDLASLVQSDSYLGLSDHSLNSSTASGTITRGEYIYMLISNVFGTSRMSSADTKKASFNDCKDAGDIASQQKLSSEDTNKDYYTSYELKFTLNNPDDGCPTRIYQALVTANELGIIGSDTRWDEGLTKTEAIQLYIDTVQAYTKENGYAVDSTGGQGEDFEVAEAQQAIVDDGSGSNVGGAEFDRDEEEVQADVMDEFDTIDEADYEIIPMEDTTFYALQAANLREGPGTQYDKVGSLTYAQEITCNGKVESDNKEWLVLKTDDGSTQMVSASLVSRTKPSTSSSSGGSGGTSSSGSGGSTSSGGSTGGSTGGSSSGGSSDSSDVSGGALSGLGLQQAGGFGSSGDTGHHWTIE